MRGAAEAGGSCHATDSAGRIAAPASCGLASVVQGHYNYYAVPGNSKAITAFRDQATGTGTMRYGAAASATARTGSGRTASQPDGSHPASCIPAPTSGSTLVPKPRAQCVKRARWDPCGDGPSHIR